jgi:hypothetical protein
MSKSYGGRLALDAVTFSIHPGELPCGRTA